MIDNKIKERILKYIEGALDPKTVEEIKNLIRENEEARTFYDKMSKLENMLHEDEFQIKEIDFEDAIMSKIEKYEKAHEQPDWFGWLSKLFPNPRLNLVYAVAAGFIIGFFVFIPLNKSKFNSSGADQIGTIYNTDAQHTFDLSIDLDSVNAEINAHYLPDDLIGITIKISSVENALLRFSFNKDNVSVWSFKPSAENTDCRVLTGLGSLKIINSGDNSYYILLKVTGDGEESLKVEILLNDGCVYEKILKINS
jgi:hypothetical protein